MKTLGDIQDATKYEVAKWMASQYEEALRLQLEGTKCLLQVLGDQDGERESLEKAAQYWKEAEDISDDVIDVVKRLEELDDQ